MNNQRSVPTAEVNGQLHLRFTYDHARQLTHLNDCVQMPPLRVVRPFSLPDGAALLHLHNLSGGVLGGDRFTITIELEPEARVQLTTTGATRLYRSRPGTLPARQETHVRVGAGGLLEYVPDGLIPFAGSRYQQSTTLELAEDAGLFWWETLAPGRLARGECFAYELLELTLDITACGRPIACERFRLQPQRASFTSPVRLGSYPYHSSFFICRVGVPTARWRQLEQELTELAERLTQPGENLWGVSALVAHGLTVRAASRRSYDLAPDLLAFWQAAKQALYGSDALPPRKLY